MMIAASQLTKSFSFSKAAQYCGEAVIFLAFIGTASLSWISLSPAKDDKDAHQEESSPYQEVEIAEEDHGLENISNDDDSDLIVNLTGILDLMTQNENPNLMKYLPFIVKRARSLPLHTQKWVLPSLLYFVNKGETFLPSKVLHYTKWAAHLFIAYRFNHSGHEFDVPHHRDNICTAFGKVGPAVVHIFPSTKSVGLAKGKVGSGIIFDCDGFILTCAYGVADYLYKKVYVSLLNQQTFEGFVISVQKKAHIAIVKINPYFPLPIAIFSPLRKLSPGDRLFIMGSPERFRSNFTPCRVRSIDNEGMGLYLEMDGSINVGNSGGPVLRMNGDLVGIHILKESNGRMVSIVLPIDGASIQEFPSKWRTRAKLFGFELANLHEVGVDNSKIKRRHPKLPDVNKGVIVTEVEQESPASSAGFEPGDIVLKFGEKPTSSAKEIIRMMRSNNTKPMNAVVKRGTKELTLPLYEKKG